MIYTCLSCNNQYKNIYTINNHTINGCKSSKPNIDISKSTFCPTCKEDISFLKTYHKIYYHMRTCNMRIKLICETCNKSYICEQSLLNHLHRHKHSPKTDEFIMTLNNIP